MKSKDGGSTFETLCSGSQRYRAVSLRFRDGHVYWGTDDPRGENHLIKRHLETGDETPLASVKGPVYYSTALDEHLLFSTAVEHGQGSQDGKARVYAVGPDDQVAELACFNKDPWHPTLFGYGTIEFPRGGLAGRRFWMTLDGLSGGHRSMLCELEP